CLGQLRTLPHGPAHELVDDHANDPVRVGLDQVGHQLRLGLEIVGDAAPVEVEEHFVQVEVDDDLDHARVERTCLGHDVACRTRRDICVGNEIVELCLLELGYRGWIYGHLCLSPGEVD